MAQFSSSLASRVEELFQMEVSDNVVIMCCPWRASDCRTIIGTGSSQLQVISLD